MRLTNRGDSKIGCTIYILIIGVILYFAFMWGTAQWNYETMKKETTDIIKILASEKKPNLEKYKTILVDKAEAADVDLYEEDIEITIKSDSVEIELFWEAPVAFPGYTYYLEYDLVKVHKKRY